MPALAPTRIYFRPSVAWPALRGTLRDALDFRFTPPNRPIPPSREPGLDALRAIAAFLVVFSHLTGDARMPLLLRNFSAGRPGVLLFFVISGYVIGRTNQRPWSESSHRDYWRRRMRRLLPLYVLAVVFSFALVAALTGSANWGALAGHLLFLQNFESYFGLWLKPVWNNEALWTLNYEMVFYALFLAVWRFRPRAWMLFAGCFLPAFFVFSIPAGAYFLPSYAMGFGFWLIGLALAWRPQAPTLSPATPGASRHFPLFALLFLLVATREANPVRIGLAAVGLDSLPVLWMSIQELALAPCCVALVGGALGARFASGRTMKLLCLLPPLLALISAAATGHDLTDKRWLPAACYTIIATLLLWIDADPSALIRRIAPWGGISYAVYLFHLPLHILALALFRDAYIAIPVFTVALTLLAGHLLERRLHPWFVDRFWPTTPTSAPAALR